MEFTPEKAALIEGLKGIRSTLNQIKTIQTEVDKKTKDREKVLEDAQKFGERRAQLLPTDNYESLIRQLGRDHAYESEKREEKTRGIFVVGQIILSLLTVVLTFLAGQVGEGMEIICRVFSVYFAVAMVVYILVDEWNPFEEFLDWLSIPGVLFFIFCMWAPFLSMIFTILAMVTIAPALAVLPLGTGIWMIVGRTMIGKSGDSGSFTENERKQLEEAKKKDQRNAVANEGRIDAAIEKSIREVQGRLEGIDQEISQAVAKMAQLQKQVEANRYLAAEDLGSVDSILYYLETNRADTLKEALHYADQERKERGDRAWQEYLRRSQELQARWDREKAESRRESEMIQLRHHREQVQKKLDEIQKQLQG